jgi:hypothetical protein
MSSLLNIPDEMAMYSVLWSAAPARHEDPCRASRGSGSRCPKLSYCIRFVTNEKRERRCQGSKLVDDSLISTTFVELKSYQYVRGRSNYHTQHHVVVGLTNCRLHDCLRRKTVCITYASMYLNHHNYYFFGTRGRFVVEPFARVRRHLQGSDELREKDPNSPRLCTSPRSVAFRLVRRLKSPSPITTVAKREARVALSIALREGPRLVSLAEWMQIIGTMPSTLRSARPVRTLTAHLSVSATLTIGGSITAWRDWCKWGNMSRPWSAHRLI